MNNHVKLNKVLQISVYMLALLVVLVNITVIADGMYGLSLILPLNPYIFAIMSKTSFIFLAFGLSIILPPRLKKKYSLLLYSAIFVFSFFALLQYLLNITWWINGLFFPAFDVMQIVSPFGVVPVVLICAIFLSIGFYLVIRYFYISHLLFVSLLCAIVTTILTAVMVINVIPLLDKWTVIVFNPVTQILILSIILILKIVTRIHYLKLERQFFIAMLVFFAGIGFVIAQWQSLAIESYQHIQSSVARSTQVLKLKVSTEYNLEHKALIRFFTRLDDHKNNIETLWRDDGDMYLHDFSDLDYMALLHGNSHYHERFRKNDVSDQLLAIFQHCNHDSINPATKGVNNEDVVSMCVYFAGKHHNGIAGINLSSFLANVIGNDPEYRLLNITIDKNDTNIFSQQIEHASRSSIRRGLQDSEEMLLGNSTIRIKILPSREYIHGLTNYSAIAFLFFGLIISMLSAILVFMIQNINITNRFLKKNVLKRTALLERKKKEYQLLYNNSPELNVTIINNAQYEIIICNHTFADKLALNTAKSLIGSSFLKYCTEKSANNLSAALVNQDIGNELLELKLLDKNGNEIYVSAAIKFVDINEDRVETFMLSMRDITREKSLENELLNQHLSQTIFKQNEELYNTLLNSVTDGWWDWQIATNDVYYSDNTRKMFGYDSQDFIDDNFALWTTVVDPQDREVLREIVDEHIRLGTPLNAILRFNHKSGKRMWVIIRGHAIVDQDGIKRRMVGTFTDVTDKYTLINEIANVSNFQQAILNGTEDLIISTDLDGMIVTFNNSSAQLLGYRAEEMINLRSLDVLHDPAELQARARELSAEFGEEVSAGFETLVYKARKTSQAEQRQWTYVTKDGTKIPVELVISILFDSDGEISGYVGVARNVSALIAKTEEIKRSQELLEQTGLVGLVGGWNMDMQTGQAQWTSAMFEILETPAEYIASIEHDVVRFFTPDSQRILSEEIQKSAQTGQPYEVDVEVITYTGKRKWGRSKGIPVMENGCCVRMYGVFQDINDRVLMLRDLQQKEQFLEQTGRVGKVGGWERNLLTNKVTWTKTMFDILGVPTDYDFTSFDTNIDKFFTPESNQLLKQTMSAAMISGESFELEMEVTTYDGRLINVFSRGVPVIENGKCVKIYGVFQDITSNVSLTNELKKEQTRLANVIDSTALGSWEWDIQDGKTTFNERWAEIIGYTLAEISPTTMETWASLVHPDDLLESNALIQKHLSGEIDHYYCEVRMKHKDGHWIWVLDRGRVTSRSDDGTPLFMYGTHQDISQFKQLQNELQQAAERFKNLFDSAPVGIAMNDFATGQFLEANNSFLNSIQYTYDELVALEYWDITPIDYEFQEQEQIESMKNTRYYGPYRKEYIRKDGSRYPVLLNGILTKDETGKDIIWSVILDISSQLRYEEQLIEARKMAEAASLAKSQFVANMSHEIRTPMNAITGLSQLLADTNLDSQQHSYIEKILSSSQLLLGIINDILDYSKIESGKLSLEEMEFDLDTILSQLITLFHANNRSPDELEFFVNINPLVPYHLIGDQLRLMQILTNLLSNAVKFTAKGKIILSIELLSSTEHKVKLRFAIKDTGIGITPEQRENLFKPFSQSDTSITRKYGGTGLGLVISAQILKIMGSSIVLDSEYGLGSTFSFDVELGYNRDIQQNMKHQKLSALVVDDEPITRIIISKMLAREDINVFEAENAQQAIDMAISGAYKFDYILMDWNMPGMNGLDAIKKINELRLNDKLHELPTILLVSAYSKDDVNLSENSNIPLLTKPITQTALMHALFPHTHQIVANRALVTLSSIDLQDCTILLVEDNLINQEVAIAMLTKVGANIIVANNGQEAVNEVRQNGDNIDLILMDLQMPVMDGYQATRKILSMDPTKLIIALTATVMKEDVENILAAGMCDHVAKPINRAKLYKTIAKWLDLQAREEVYPDEVKTTTNDNNDVIDLQQALGVLNGDEKLLKQLLTKFKAQLANAITELEPSVNNEDSGAAKSIVHSLKGVAGNLGINQLYHYLSNLEQALKIGTILDTEEYAKFSDIVVEHINYLDENYSIDNTAENLAGDKNRLMHILQEISIKIASYELIDANVINELQSVSHGIIDTNTLNKLIDYLENFVYDDAQNLIDDILQGD